MTKGFERILIVMLENQYRQYVLQDKFMSKLAQAGADMRNYFGAFHPSQTNYIASLAAEVCAVTNDTVPSTPLMQETMVDVLEPAGISWKAYMEAYPSEDWNPRWENSDYPEDMQPCVKSPGSGPRLARYFRKHNAFASFHNIQSKHSRWKRIVSEYEFWEDIADGQLPEYSWFSPDIWNDGHYLYNTHLESQPRTQLIPQISAWLEHVFLGKIETDILQEALSARQKSWGLNLDIDLLLSNPEEAYRKSNLPAGTLLVITFDEADFNASGYDTNYDGPNQVYTVLLGDMITPGTVIDTPYNHYSLMKTVQRNFGASDLGKNDRHANWFRFLQGERFSWSSANDTGIESSGDLALASDQTDTCLVYRGKEEELLTSRFDGVSWSEGTRTGIQAAERIALVSHGGTMMLVNKKADGQLFMATRDAAGEWTCESSLGQRASGEIAMTSYRDTADNKHKIMLCWQSEKGFIHYTIYQDSAWQETAGEVGQLSDGPMVLGQHGTSLYLVYQQRNSRKLHSTSYNLAPFNAFEAQTFDDKTDTVNDTSLHQWSPFDMPVGYFARKSANFQNDYQTIGRLALGSIEGEMHLAHRAAYVDTPEMYTEYFGLTGIFTAAHAMGHGWGTIKQAGWTKEQCLTDACIDPEGGVAMTNHNDRLIMVWQEAGGKALKFCSAGYSDRAST